MKLSIITLAYNSDKYIDACARSVLNQTLRDIEWVVLDNGSTDNTGKILEGYAAGDKRIKLLKNKDNFLAVPDGEYIISWWSDLVAHCDGEYFALLDSDDTYDLTFAEKMYDFAKKHDADIAACGTSMSYEEDPSLQGDRISPLFTDSDCTKLGDQFPYYYGTFRPVWGKLLRKSLYEEHEKFLTDIPDSQQNGMDTFFCLRFMQVAKKIVCLDVSLHHYLIRKKSAYHSNFYIDRWRAYDCLYYEGLDLLSKWNKLSAINQSFICLVHFHSLLDCIKVVMRSVNAPAEERVLFLKKMLSSEVFRSYAGYLDAKQKEDMFQDTYEVVDAVYNHDLGELFLWCCWLYDRFPVFATAKTTIERILAESLLLRNLNVSQAICLQVPVADVLRDNLHAATDALLMLAQNSEIPDEYTETFLVLGSNVCAAAENTGAYVFFMKIWISYLIDRSQMEEAHKQLVDFERIYPEDDDFMELRRKLEHANM